MPAERSPGTPASIGPESAHFQRLPVPDEDATQLSLTFSLRTSERGIVLPIGAKDYKTRGRRSKAARRPVCHLSPRSNDHIQPRRDVLSLPPVGRQPSLSQVPDAAGTRVRRVRTETWSGKTIVTRCSSMPSSARRQSAARCSTRRRGRGRSESVRCWQPRSPRSRSPSPEPR